MTFVSRLDEPACLPLLLDSTLLLLPLSALSDNGLDNPNLFSQSSVTTPASHLELVRTDLVGRLTKSVQRHTTSSLLSRSYKIDHDQLNDQHLDQDIEA